MYDIFLSYSTQDRERLRPLFAALSQQGWSVFWDHQTIHAGENWHLKIDDAINNSRCVVVVWSTHSVKSEWVLEEAHKGKNRGVLLPIRIDAVEPPFGFSLRQAGNFIHWNNKPDHPAFIELAAQIYGLLGKPPESPPLPPSPQPQSRSGMMLAGIAAVAMAGGGVWYMQSQSPAPEGHEAKAEPVVAAPPVAQPLPVTPAAEEAKGYRLIVSVTPVNAVVTVDGNAFDPDKELVPGRYTVKATADGYRPMETTIAIQNQDEKLSLELGKLEPERLPFEPEMVDIPAGGFTMGCKDGRDNVEGMDKCPDYEKPVHEVNLKAFKLAKTETTVGQYMACVDAGGCPPPEWKAKDEPDYYKELGNALTDPDHPIVGVSWNNANSYVHWLGEETGKQYRLPTEAEWEYAARAGTDTAYPWGSVIGENKANCSRTLCGDAFEYTSPAGSFAVNPFGLYDLNGNVWEWVEDCWSSDYKDMPDAGSARQGCGADASRVLRGGSGYEFPWTLRSASRITYTPDSRGFDVGFRVARTN